MTGSGGEVVVWVWCGVGVSVCVWGGEDSRTGVCCVCGVLRACVRVRAAGARTCGGGGGGEGGGCA